MPTFSEFKDSFYSRVPGLSVFDCGSVNLTKVVLDGLVVNYTGKNIFDQEIFDNKIYCFTKKIARRLIHGRSIMQARKAADIVKSKINSPNVLFDPGRTAYDINGKSVSYYFNRIENTLKNFPVCKVIEKSKENRRDITIADCYLSTRFNFLSAQDKSFVRGLKKAYGKMVAVGIFTDDELRNIRIALTKFFDEYRLWRNLLENSNPKTLIFTRHYHREGMMLAFREKKTRLIELQHGLIASEDIFYAFPPRFREVATRALLPDKIFTYGKYWNKFLEEGNAFLPTQIGVVGLYQEINTVVSEKERNTLSDFLKGQDFILITTQTHLHQYFVEYIVWLSNHLLITKSDLKIVVKNHPLERVENYDTLKDSDNVKIINCNTEYLLSKCKYHISSYSTTLYDALKYNCKNFSLLIDICLDYIQSFLVNGISKSIKIGESPLMESHSNANTSKINGNEVFESFEQHYQNLLAELK